MHDSEVKKSLDRELTRLYPILLDRCRGLIRNKDEAREMLHTVLENALSNEKRIETLIDLHSRGSLEYYLNRCIYLSARSPTSKYGRHNAPSTEFGEYHEYMISFEDWQDAENRMSRAATSEQINLLIGQLPSFDGELLKLWMMPGFSFVVASETTGISRRIMHASIHESIQKLRKYVHNTNGTPIRAAGKNVRL